MRLSAQIIQSAEQRTNPLGERELLLRSLAIPSIEHLSVSRDQFDTIDLTNNYITKLENFPRLNRLTTLYLGGNEIGNVDARNLRRNLPNLKCLVLTGCGVRGWNVLGDLGVGCPELEFLSLVGNPVTKRQHYRLYTINKIPSLKVLDFTKIKQSERDRAKRLASSAAGAAMDADAKVEAATAAAVTPATSAAAASTSPYNADNTDIAYDGQNGIHTFEPGEGKSAEESFATQFTLEEKAKIREMVANAASAEEIDRIESLVKKGIFPGSDGGVPPPPPPPPPLPEDSTGENGRGEKRPAEDGGDGVEDSVEKGSKKQRSE